MSENYSPNQSEGFPDLIKTCDLNGLRGLFFLEYIDKNFTYFLYKFDTFQLEAVEAALGHLFSKIVGLD